MRSVIILNKVNIRNSELWHTENCINITLKLDTEFIFITKKYDPCNSLVINANNIRTFDVFLIMLKILTIQTYILHLVKYFWISMIILNIKEDSYEMVFHSLDQNSFSELEH